MMVTCDLPTGKPAAKPDPASESAPVDDALV